MQCCEQDMSVQEPRGLCNLQASPAEAPNQDSRITILFDLNGVLIRAKSAELEAKGVRQHPFEARRGVKHLLSLWPQFRLGLFTSATAKTAQNRLNLLDALLWADPKTSVRPPHLRTFRAILIVAPRFFMKRRASNICSCCTAVSLHFPVALACVCVLACACVWLQQREQKAHQQELQCCQSHKIRRGVTRNRNITNKNRKHKEQKADKTTSPSLISTNKHKTKH
jgi:hypothetical protein